MVLLALALSPPAQGQPAAPDGTYAVWICEAPCALADSSRAAVSGRLVLGAPIPRPAIPEDVRGTVGSVSVFMRNEGVPNACFVLERHDRFAGILAGAIPVALTRWLPSPVAEDDPAAVGFTITLYASPDAFSGFTVVAAGDTLRGAGRRSGFIGDPFEGEDGYLVGRRLRAADPDLCWQAVRARLR